ncbi:MAG: GNAT family N-acetyltransferase [Bacteroidia bacterium]
MEFTKRTKLNKLEKQQLLELWNTEYPSVIAHSTTESFELYLEKLESPCHHFVIDNNNVLGWFCEFNRNGEPNFAMIMAKISQKKGIGTQLISEAKMRNSQLNGWVVLNSGYLKSDGSPYLSPVGFYKKNGFEILNDQVWETETLKTVKIRWQKS